MISLLEQRLPIFVYHVSRITEHCIADIVYTQLFMATELKTDIPFHWCISMRSQIGKKVRILYHKSVSFRQGEKTDKKRQLCEIWLKNMSSWVMPFSLHNFWCNFEVLNQIGKRLYGIEFFLYHKSVSFRQGEKAINKRLICKFGSKHEKLSNAFLFT